MTEPRFKVGERVRVIDISQGQTSSCNGKIATVESYSKRDIEPYVYRLNNLPYYWAEKQLEKVREDWVGEWT